MNYHQSNAAFQEAKNTDHIEGPQHPTPGLKKIDVAGFARDINQLKKETYASISEKDLDHLKRVEMYGKVGTVLGLGTAWIIPNPISAFLISMGLFTRWLLAHHITHRGYDRVPNVPKKYHSKHFARGWRRFIDWFDWILPAAWDHEHNELHHYHTGEDEDPDLVERHLEFFRALKIPRPIKYLLVILAGCTWKFTYYAPNTMSVLDPVDQKPLKSEHIVFITIKNIFNFKNRHVRRLWTQCYLPYATVHFAIIPLLFFPLGKTAVLFVLINKLIAEVMTNFHSFLVVAPNHTADDLYRFDFHYDKKEEFYVTQVLGSANYYCGTELIDYASIWLNYQIEHHLFPELPMTKYREIQPKIKALCEKYNLPYKQEHMFKRFKRMCDIAVGKTSMMQLKSFDEIVRA